MKFIYKKRGLFETWKYSKGNSLFTVTKDDLFCLTVQIGESARQFNFKTLIEASNFIEVNY